MTGKVYKFIDLNAGIGSVKKGLEMTKRFKSVLAVEPDPYAQIVYQHLYKEKVYKDIHSNQLKKELNTNYYDVLVSTWPSNYCFRCDSVVIKKNRPGANSSVECLNVLKQVKPVAFMIISADSILDYDRGRVFNSLIKTLDSYSYRMVGIDVVGDKVVYSPKDIVRNFSDFGLPQDKNCVIIMGFKKRGIKKNYQFPPLPKKGSKVIYPSVHSLLDGGVEPKYYLSQTLLDTLKIKSEKSQKPLIINGSEWQIIFSLTAIGVYGKERNLVRQPLPSYIGMIIGNKPAINKEGIRFLTPNEWGKLHGFVNYAFLNNGVDYFSFPSGISDKKKYQLFGNSFSIPMIEEIGYYMALRLDDFYLL